MAKLKLKKFIELKKDEHKIFVIEQDEQGNVNPDSLFIESDLCDEELLNRTVSNYRLADETDIYHGAEENSLCVELLQPEQHQHRQYKERNTRNIGHIDLYDIRDRKPKGCNVIPAPSYNVSCGNSNCPFYNGTCIWLKVKELIQSVQLDEVIKVDSQSK